MGYKATGPKFRYRLIREQKAFIGQAHDPNPPLDLESPPAKRLVAISKEQLTAGTVAGATVGTLSAAEYWKTLTLAFLPVGESLPGPTSRLKRWNGSSWVVANVKVGPSWAVKPLKKF